MRISKIDIKNFRGIKEAHIFLSGHSVFVGDNNSGKSTIFEAIDLVLGPDRLSKRPVVDEHDFYAGEYLIDSIPVEIVIEVIVTDLSEEQQRHFINHIEWWNTSQSTLIEGPPAEATDGVNVIPALRICFKGYYDVDEDDFLGQTYFISPKREDGELELFRTKEKRVCGFLFLRTLRTGSRALSLEHGSLLDIILRLKELRPQMWEKMISQVSQVSVATEPELGISNILTEVQSALHSFVNFECADNPSIKVSNMTREHLRKIVTVFMDSGVVSSSGTRYSTPYYNQGTGTINILVLSLLSIIAELKQNVIFAMEEPEIAIPPHIQKRIVLSVVSKSAQAIFTSHSPYILEEFEPRNVMVVSRMDGIMNVIPAEAPPNVKTKKYKEEFRKRFCESLLSRRVLITEGRTEYDVYSSVARRLEEINCEKYLSFERLGISLVNAETDSQIAVLGQYYRGLGKTVFAIFDKQSEEAKSAIVDTVDYPYEAEEHGIENIVLKGSNKEKLKKFALDIVCENEWPQHLTHLTPTVEMVSTKIEEALFEYFKWSKGSNTLADFLVQCDETEMPESIVTTIADITENVKTRITEPEVTFCEPCVQAE